MKPVKSVDGIKQRERTLQEKLAAFKAARNSALEVLRRSAGASRRSTSPQTHQAPVRKPSGRAIPGQRVSSNAAMLEEVTKGCSCCAGAKATNKPSVKELWTRQPSSPEIVADESPPTTSCCDSCDPTSPTSIAERLKMIEAKEAQIVPRLQKFQERRREKLQAMHNQAETQIEWLINQCINLSATFYWMRSLLASICQRKETVY